MAHLGRALTKIRGTIEQPGDRQGNSEDGYAGPAEAGITPPTQRRADRAAGEERSKIKCIHATALFGRETVNRPLAEDQIGRYRKIQHHRTQYDQPYAQP